VDTWRIANSNEILAFYGLCTGTPGKCPSSALADLAERERGLKRGAQLSRRAEVFALGLSDERTARIFMRPEMCLTPQPDGTYRAAGEKYYIGNGNKAPMVSTFGKFSRHGRLT